MRLVPNRYVFPGKPSLVKKVRAKLVHVSPPVKGLAEAAATAEADPKFAGILINVYVDDDRITVRAGHRVVATMTGAAPIEHLIPYYGSPNRLLAATNNTLCDAEIGDVLKGGFTNNDWHWTSFSNLGDAEYVVMVNGNDGVWSWDGLETANGPSITVTKLEKLNPARVTVGAADIGQFQNADSVNFTGADAGHASANGVHYIQKVGQVANTFELVGVDGTGWGADQTTGTMRVVEQGSFVKEPITSNLSWIQPDQFAIVVAHQNRLFFADESNLCVYYLPIQQKYGALDILPLNAIFKRGGTIRAMNTWTVDGGMGMDDQLVIFTSNGEAAIYSGVDPDSDFTLVGVYRFESPMSKWSTLNYGGELYALIPTGLTPMSTVLKAGREGVEAADKNVITKFLKSAVTYRANPGWEVYINPNSGRMMCNVPQGGGVYGQMVRGMAKPVWSELRNIPARCWAWMEPYNYFGSDKGVVYQMHPSIQNDHGEPIYIDVQMAWNQFKTPAIKQFKMILPYIITDGYPKPRIDVKVDFDTTPPENQPDLTLADPNDTTWDVGAWDTSTWVSGTSRWMNWTGVGSLGRVAAIRMTAAVYNCSFSCTGWDVIYEEGSVFG